MFKLSTLKTTLAAVAGLMALATWAPAAEAGSITLVYDTVSSTATGKATLELTISDTGYTDTQNGTTYSVYTIDSVSGTRVSVSNNTGQTSTETITGLYGLGAGEIQYDRSWLANGTDWANYGDLLLYNNSTGAVALNTLGLAYLTSDGNTYNIYYYTYSKNGTTVYGYDFQGDDYPYAESSATRNQDAAAVTIYTVPGPAPLALLGASLVGLAIVRRRKQA